MARIRNRTVAELDLGVIGAGVLLLVFSFLHWFGNSFAYLNAWDSGFFAYTGVELGLVAAAIAGAAALTSFQFPRLGASWGVIVFALSALGSVSILLKLLIGYHSVPRGIGLWLALLVSIAESVVAFLAFSSRGERLPGISR
ncbi:MAG: hypothetical protein ACQSGP_15945 [Frankia sp.]